MGAFLLAFITCKKEPDPNIQTFEIIRENPTVGTTSVTIEGTYSYAGVIDGIKACVSENGGNVMEFDAELNEDEFFVTMPGLKPATEYQYYYAVDYGFQKPFNTEPKTFTTLNTEKPTVKALEWLKIDNTTYRIKCQVVADGGTEITERGICWNTFGDPMPYDDSTRRYDGSVGVFEEYLVRMEHLELGTPYFVRAFAKNAAGKIGWSEEWLYFETSAPAGSFVNIGVSSNPDEGGTANGGGTYEVGTQCTVTAVAYQGYTFVNWTENDAQVSSDTVYTFPVTTSRSLVANFTRQAYVIFAEVDPENSGTVTGAHGYNYGEECVLTATPNTGYDFVKWTKGGATVSTDPECRFTVTETATYKAHFRIKSYTVEVLPQPSNGGTVEGEGTYNHGQNCTVIAMPAEGYAFTNWTDDGDVVSAVAEYTFAVTSNRTLVANFTELQPDEYNIQVSANPSNGGSVEGGGTYTQGASCRVKATPQTGFNFINWTENGNQVWDLLEYTFTVEGNRNLMANFEAQTPTEYTINVSANPSNGGGVTGGGTYQQDGQCTVEATENEGYTFINWTEDGEEASPNTRYTFIVTSDRTLVANFEIKHYTIEVSAEPTNGGTASGGGDYNHGESCTVSATAKSGYAFVNWTENDSVVSDNANYTFTVKRGRTLVAHFEVQAPNTYNINVSANPTNGGTVSGNQNPYTYGQTCSLTASPASGYSFIRWTENGNEVSTNPNYSFTVTGNRTLVAQFQAQQYTVTATANPTNGGTISGNQSPYTYGQTCSLTATANNGYAFDHWTKNGTTITGGATITFEVTASATYVAHFTQQSYTITVSSDPANGGTVQINNGTAGSTATATFAHGTTIQLKATANSGYAFSQWNDGGAQTHNVTVTAGETYTAYFTAQPQAPTGAINGLFTINANGDQVYFAQGNLQYQASTNTWRFATNQWDYIGEANANISYTYSGWVDLFGWGTSGYNHGAVCYQPWSTSQTNSDYFAYGQAAYNLYDQTGQAEWGYNTISNGGNQTSQWRTLTEWDNGEWHFVFNTRSTTSGIRYVKAQVNGINGVVLLPDDWSASYYLLNNTNSGGASFSSNIISASQWVSLEQHGAVFLPAAGYRDGTSVCAVGSYGQYWSADYADDDRACFVYFNDVDLRASYAISRSYGHSVRLVCPAQ